MGVRDTATVESKEWDQIKKPLNCTDCDDSDDDCRPRCPNGLSSR